jgi:hypothetical protein
MVALPEFDLRNVDGFEDFAKAAWFARITNFPQPDPTDIPGLKDEVYALRAKLLRDRHPGPNRATRDRQVAPGRPG